MEVTDLGPDIWEARDVDATAIFGIQQATDRMMISPVSAPGSSACAPE